MWVIKRLCQGAIALTVISVLWGRLQACHAAAPQSPRAWAISADEKGDIASYFEHDERLLKALHYRESSGARWVLAFGGNDHSAKLSDNAPDEHPPGDPGYVSLHAYGLLEDHGGYLTKWQIHDSNESALCSLQMLLPLVDVIDAGDGEPLVVVPYWRSCDGLDPTTVKLILDYKGQKYAIRGALPNQKGDEITQVTGDNFDQLPGNVRSTALAYWDNVLAATKRAAGWEAP